MSLAAEHPLSEELSPARQWLALSVLLLAVLVMAIDNTVLGVAVPTLSADLRLTSTELLWIVDAYAFVLAGLLITMGNLGDRPARRLEPVRARRSPPLLIAKARRDQRAMNTYRLLGVPVELLG